MNKNRNILEWGWNAHAETYYVSAKVGQKGTRFLVGGGWLVVGGRVERSGATRFVKKWCKVPPLG